MDYKIGPMENALAKLMLAQNVAKMWHWKTRSFAQHIALGELYDGITKLTDELAEMYMGAFGTDGHIPLSEPNGFSEQDPVLFVQQLHFFLAEVYGQLPEVPFIVNKFEELQALVATVKYKMDNLK
jgi:hypothetical protein